MADIATRISIYADDQASASFRRVGQEADGLAQRVTALGPVLQTVLAGSFAGLGLSTAMTEAEHYQSALTNMSRVTSRDLGAIRKDVSSLSVDLGSQTQLMVGFYDTMAAGVEDPREALERLSVAAQGAKVAQISQAQSVTALTKLMTGYGAAVKNAADASDFIFAIEDVGVTTFGELTAHIGDLAGISSQAGIGLDEMGATFAAITKTAGGTSEAATQYTRVVMGLFKPTQQLTELLGQMGYQSGQALIQAKGLPGALLAIREAAGSSGVEMGKLFESSEALTALGPLFRTNFSEVYDFLDKIKERTGATARAFDRWKETIAGLKEIRSNSLDNLGKQVGEIFQPVQAEGLRALNAGLQALSDNFDTVTKAGGAVVTGLAVMTAARRTASSATAQHFVEEARLQVAQATGQLTILGSARATAEKAVADLAAATAQRDAAAAAVVRFKAEQSAAVAITGGTQASIIRAAQQKQLAALTAVSTAAEARYAVALAASTAASARASAAGTALTVLRRGVSGLVSLMGGPLGLALTGTALAVYGAVSATREHESMLAKYGASLSSVGDAAKAAGDKITAMDVAMASAAKTAAERDLEKARKDLQTMQNAIDASDPAGARSYLTENSEIFSGYRADADAAARAIKNYQNGLADAYQTQQALVDLQKQFGSTYATDKALDWINGILGGMKEVETQSERLDAVNGKLDGMQQSAAGAAEEIKGLAAAMALLGSQGVTPATSLSGAILSLREYTKETKSAKKEAADLAKARAVGDLEVIKSAAQAARTAGKTAEAAKLDAEWKKLSSRMGEVAAPSTKGASGIANAREQLQRLREEMATMRGEGTKASATLDQKEREIAKLGKAAGLSAGEVTKMQTQYAAAFQSSTIKDFNKELAQVAGNTSALRDIEISDKVREWESRFQAAGIAADEYRPKIDDYKKALSEQAELKDLQTATSFYKELTDLSGQYGLGIAEQNRLIDLQKKAWEQAGVPKTLIDQWEKLKQLQVARDPLSGLQRGLTKFGSQYGDLAAQVETTTTNMGSTIANTLSDAFMKGKLSAADFFTSLLSMAAQAMSNYFVGQMFSGIGAMFSVGSNSGSLPVIGGPDGGGVVPGYIHHAGGLVGSGSAPTRSMPVSAFADAPRFHDGGGFLQSDERAAILQTEELVLNRAETRAYIAGRNAAGLDVGSYSAIAMPQPMNQQITINFYDKDGNKQQQTARNDGMGGMTIDVLLGEIDKGLAQRVSQGKSQTARALDLSRGLSTARQLYS